LRNENWITCGNALQLDWLSVCPATGTGVKLQADDLFETPLDQAEIDFQNEGGETYICGNPPYLGSTWQSDEQKADLQAIFGKRTKNWKSLDYVAGWFMKAADYGTHTPTTAAFVSTNSICQGQQVPILWPAIFQTGSQIVFAHTSFKWTNLAAHNAGVTVAVVGVSAQPSKARKIFSLAEDGSALVREAEYINAYLVAGPDVIIDKTSDPLDARGAMDAGGKPVEGGNLFLSADEKNELLGRQPQAADFIKAAYGASEYIRGEVRHCLWIGEADSARAKDALNNEV
jgi:hypothetical protein